MSDENNGLTDRLNQMRSGSKASDADEVEDFPCYGCIRGNRRAFNIELRRLKGSWPAPEYTWLQYAEWCPVELTLPSGDKVAGGSSLLHFQSGEKVVISGRNVRSIHLKILEHQVKYVAEADRTIDMAAEDDAVVVSFINVIEAKLA